MRFGYQLLCATSLIVASINTAQGLQYRIEKAFIEGMSVPGHETVTSMGIDCFNKASGEFPTNCLKKPSYIGLLNEKTTIDIPKIPKLNAQELLDASSFPDDPGRVGDTLKGGAKGFFLNKEKCEFRPFYQLGFGKKRQYFNDITGGLFCNSHYGVLQFWHSMASRPMPSENAPTFNDIPVEPYQKTLNKILGWAAFTYKISRDNNAAILRQEFCPYFNSLKKDSLMKDMALAFVPDEELDLYSGQQFHCEDLERPFRVRFIFKQECDGVFSASSCNSLPNDQQGNRKIQIAALGSLVHMIQDSYSQSHVIRNKYDPLTPARIDCAPIKAYLTYKGQDPDKHGESDVFPLSINQNCSTNIIDDPITATAKVLWYVNHADDKTDELITYLKGNVFKSAYTDNSLAPNASAGDNFKL
jgi:hypothetical protein